ncbi:PQ-loop repeat-containing protein [Candidatus Babeliales bacterium]|nr:PQ-loop repeat-containing protein [Candidatus Babeliales bacterium]
MEPNFLITFFMWFINISYLGALLPQLFLNYKMKTTSGLSDLYILGYFSGYAAHIFYVYGLNFPVVYRIMGPFALLAVALIVFQRFFYRDIQICFGSLKLYFIGLLIIITAIFIFLNSPKIVGMCAGWVAMVIWSVYQLPQVFKIYQTKSVKGFSFLLVSMIAVGNLIEFIIAFVLNWPIQSLLIALRGLIIYSIFCVQFWKYSEYK